MSCNVSLVTEYKRDAEAAEAAGPTLTTTLEQLRAADASVAEFVVAGGVSSFQRLVHKATTAQTVIPGVWQSSCSCGWSGRVFGSTGARSSAVSDRYMHLEEVSR